MVARPGELLLSAEAMSLPRRVGFFPMKLFGGPGKPEASLGEPEFRKMPENDLFAPPLGYFRILDQNIE